MPQIGPRSLDLTYARGMASTTTLDQIEQVLESIRPALQSDGGDVEFLSFDEERGVVEVRLTGACETCPISMMTLKQGIERRMMMSIPTVTEVQAR